MFLSRRTLIGLLTTASLMPSLLVSAADKVQAIEVEAKGTRSTGFKVVDDHAARAIIVTGDSPLPAVGYAASELQSHIERATDVRLSVVTEKEAAASNIKNRIYLGQTAAAKAAGLSVDDLPPNSFRMKVTANDIYLAGKDDNVAPPLEDLGSMGTLLAVYEWLENHVGVKWLWPGENGTVIPKSEDLFAGAPGEQTVTPALIHARPRLNTWAGMDLAKRDKYVYDTSVWLRRQRFVRGTSFDYGHGYTTYWEKYGSTHPEYFAMKPDGKREPFDPKRPQLVQMCVSNPGLHKQIVENWLIQRREKPQLPWINGIENDKTAQDPACTCEVCRSWDAKKTNLTEQNPWLSSAEKGQKAAVQPSLSDRYARFWLALQEEGKKHDPNATVIGYAYADYTAPPVETKLNSNIVVGIVPPYSFPLDAKARDDFRELWDGWAKTGARLYLRPNYFLTGYAMPYVFAEEYGEEFRYAAQRGMIGSDFDSLLGMWGVQGINLYMMGRLNAHPSLSVTHVMDEYFTAFGPATRTIREYFQFWQGVTAKFDGNFKQRSKGGWAFVSKDGDQVYTPATFQQGSTLLARATAEAKGDAEVLSRIAFLKLWLDHAELCMKTLAAFHAQKGKPDDIQLQTAFTEAKDALDAFREAHSDDIVNVGVLRQVEAWSGWRKSSELKK